MPKTSLLIPGRLASVDNLDGGDEQTARYDYLDSIDPDPSADLDSAAVEELDHARVMLAPEPWETIALPSWWEVALFPVAAVAYLLLVAAAAVVLVGVAVGVVIGKGVRG